MLIRTILKRFIISFILIITVCVSNDIAYANSIAVSSPWVAEIARFIAKDKIKVRSLSRWDANGNVIVVSHPKINEVVIVLNEKEMKKFRIRNKSRVKILYNSNNLDFSKIRTAFYDPAMLPFLAQRTMEIIAETDVKRYSFYQRRLAEFQSRINSTIDVGRHMLSDTKILDLTVSEGVWIQASAFETIKPPQKLWSKWKKGELTSLKETLDETKKRKWLVIIDSWTPNEIKVFAQKYNNTVFLPAPKNDFDSFAYLHEMLILLSNRKKELFPEK